MFDDVSTIICAGNTIPLLKFPDRRSEIVLEMVGQSNQGTLIAIPEQHLPRFDFAESIEETFLSLWKNTQARKFLESGRMFESDLIEEINSWIIKTKATCPFGIRDLNLENSYWAIVVTPSGGLYLSILLAFNLDSCVHLISTADDYEKTLLQGFLWSALQNSKFVQTIYNKSISLVSTEYKSITKSDLFEKIPVSDDHLFLYISKDGYFMPEKMFERYEINQLLGRLKKSESELSNWRYHLGWGRSILLETNPNICGFVQSIILFGKDAWDYTEIISDRVEALRTFCQDSGFSDNLLLAKLLRDYEWFENHVASFQLRLSPRLGLMFECLDKSWKLSYKIQSTQTMLNLMHQSVKEINAFMDGKNNERQSRMLGAIACLQVLTLVSVLTDFMSPLAEFPLIERSSMGMIFRWVAILSLPFFVFISIILAAILYFNGAVSKRNFKNLFRTQPKFHR
jgi:hypothetical protein